MKQKKMNKKLTLNVQTVSNLNEVFGGATAHCQSTVQLPSDCIACPTESTPQYSGCMTQCGTCGGGGGTYKCVTSPENGCLSVFDC